MLPGGRQRGDAVLLAILAIAVLTGMIVTSINQGSQNATKEHKIEETKMVLRESNRSAIRMVDVLLQSSNITSICSAKQFKLTGPTGSTGTSEIQVINGNITVSTCDARYLSLNDLTQIYTRPNAKIPSAKQCGKNSIETTVQITACNKSQVTVNAVSKTKSASLLIGETSRYTKAQIQLAAKDAPATNRPKNDPTKDRLVLQVKELDHDSLYLNCLYASLNGKAPRLIACNQDNSSVGKSIDFSDQLNPNGKCNVLALEVRTYLPQNPSECSKAIDKNPANKKSCKFNQTAFQIAHSGAGDQMWRFQSKKQMLTGNRDHFDVRFEDSVDKDFNDYGLGIDADRVPVSLKDPTCKS